MPPASQCYFIKDALEIFCRLLRDKRPDENPNVATIPKPIHPDQIPLSGDRKSVLPKNTESARARVYSPRKRSKPQNTSKILWNPLTRGHIR